MIQIAVNFILDTVGNWGYVGIFIMMVIESSFFPFPSEVAMIPAGYLSSIGEMNFIISLLVGTFGAIVGATINYFLAFYLGEPVIKKLIHRYGKYIFLSESHFKQAEKYFSRHGSITIFVARFIPAIRQLISLPAGAFKMSYTKFFVYTGLGAGIWNLILMFIGYMAGENKELLKQYSKEALFISIIFILFISLVYCIYTKSSKNNK